MYKLFLLFVVVPLVEIAILIRVGSWIGFWPTVGLVIATAAIGSALARREGLTAFIRFQEALAGQRPLGRELLDGLIILGSAVLLLTPGIVTDIFGLLGLFPLTRPIIRNLIRRNINIAVVTSGGRATSVENEYGPPSHTMRQEPGTREGRPKRAVETDGYETTMSGSAASRPKYTNADGEPPSPSR